MAWFSGAIVTAISADDYAGVVALMALGLAYSFPYRERISAKSA